MSGSYLEVKKLKVLSGYMKEITTNSRIRQIHVVKDIFIFPRGNKLNFLLPLIFNLNSLLISGIHKYVNNKYLLF